MITLPGGSAAFTQPQRTTAPLPGSGGCLLLTIDDITRGQVMVSVATGEGAPLLGPVSLQEGASAGFALGEHRYALVLDELRNSLVGKDLALFRVVQAEGAKPAPAAAGRAEIERLIASVASLDGAVFVRNGVEHSAAQAAEHLRNKWARTSPPVSDPDRFIRDVASASSQSGRPYLIRFRDGREVESAQFLREELSRLRATP